MSSSPSTVATTTPVTSLNTTSVTKSKEQILIQSSGAMIAAIVIVIIIVLAVVLIALKTYNRRTHASRLLGDRTGSKPRPKLSHSTAQSNLPLHHVGVSSVSGSLTNSNPPPDSALYLPTAELGNTDGSQAGQFSTTSDYSESTSVSVHDLPPSENT